MTEIITLSERIRQDGIRIIFDDLNEITKMIDNHRTNDGTRYEWRLVLCHNLHSGSLVVGYTNSIDESTKNPDVKDVFHEVISDAWGIVNSSDFVDWARQNYSIDLDKISDSNDYWDYVDKGLKVYNESLARVEHLRTFLGPKFDAYMSETTLDI